MVTSPKPCKKKLAELFTLSNFSFLKSASHPEEIVEHAHTLNLEAIAITDECSLAAIVRAWRKQKTLNANCKTKRYTKLIIGSSFQYDGHVFVIIASNKTAYHQLCQLITQCRLQAPKGEYHFDLTMLKKVMTQGVLLWLPDPLLYKHAKEKKIIIDQINAQCLPVYLLSLLDLTQEDDFRRKTLISITKDYSWPIIATSGAYMHIKTRKPLYDALTAIRLNKSIYEIQHELLPNAERHLKSYQQMSAIHPKKHIENSSRISDMCTFDLEEIKYQYPQSTVPDGLDPHYYLRQSTWRGAHKRYGRSIPKKVRKDIKKEFKLIRELEYEYYFLTVYDITQFAKRKGILHQGRGSAANSVVCFCLGITEVDPTKVQLLFERFISRRRNEPPDIDVDFDNSRREEVIQYLYKKYGREHCAIAATVITYRPKSALRDLAKAMGMDLLQLESIMANYGWRYRNKNWIDEIINHQTLKDSHQIKTFKILLRQLLGFPRHLSQHVGGFVLSDTPLSQLVPIENASMINRTVIQWDKDDLEALKLMKIDVLALGMLAAIQKCLENLSVLKDRTFTLQDIPRSDDPHVYHMLQKADSVGLFQVESRAQMNMLPRLKPKTFYDLVVQVAIVRPGPIHGDMVHPYLKRKHGLEPVNLPLPSMKPILERTFGVPIFQEQVIALSMIAADFSADEAEELRRSMASWKKQGHMNGLREKLSTNLAKKGVDEQYINRICKQIEGFGEYGFPESHAASFALIAYYSAWMKYYHPAVFCCALLNTQPMGFYTPWQLIQDVQQHDVEVLPVDVNFSEWAHKVVNDRNILKIRLGFKLIKGLQPAHIEAVIHNRPSQGYQTITDILQTTTLERHEIESLSAAHAFKSLGANRYENRWRAQGYDFYSGLFSQQEENSRIETNPSRSDHFLQDLQSTGITLQDHPLAYIRDHGILEDCLSAQQLLLSKHKCEVYVAGLVTNRQRPKTSAGVTFLTLEDETGSINVVVWLSTAQRQLKTLIQSKALKVYGKVDKDDTSGIVHLIAYRLFDISGQLSGLTMTSRDYH